MNLPTALSKNYIYVNMMFFNRHKGGDSLSRSMQDEVIRIATEKLGRPLSKELMGKVRQDRWSLMGLEMMIDAVRTKDKLEIESYLSRLE